MAALLRGLNLINGVAELTALTIFVLVAVTAAVAVAAGDGMTGGLGVARAARAEATREVTALTPATQDSSALDADTRASSPLFSCDFAPPCGVPFGVPGVTAVIPPGRVGVV